MSESENQSVPGPSSASQGRIERLQAFMGSLSRREVVMLATTIWSVMVVLLGVLTYPTICGKQDLLPQSPVPPSESEQSPVRSAAEGEDAENTSDLSGLEASITQARFPEPTPADQRLIYPRMPKVERPAQDRQMPSVSRPAEPAPMPQIRPPRERFDMRKGLRQQAERLHLLEQRMDWLEQRFERRGSSRKAYPTVRDQRPAGHRDQHGQGIALECPWQDRHPGVKDRPSQGKSASDAAPCKKQRRDASRPAEPGPDSGPSGAQEELEGVPTFPIDGPLGGGRTL